MGRQHAGQLKTPSAIALAGAAQGMSSLEWQRVYLS
ncbi:hypothetical protein JO379_002741 [Streptomyces syringium]|uniref:Uncharacterized protein n=1 Tax=Streptomyces syringium TaxID=76729 RepID=A0ABS4Y4A1_9ACTN|nr:hypothetical protein [Streptomyces syringium]